MGNKEYSISEVIDSFGLTKNTWTVFILLAFAMILDGYDFMIVNSTNLFVAHTFWPDNPNPGVLMGSLTTWGLLGMVIGGAIGGIVSDRIGRKKMLILAVVFYGAFTLPQAFANDLVFFAVFRLIAGLGAGSCIPIVTTMLSESVPSNRRGLFIGIGQACMVGGWVVAGLIANPICNATTPLLGEFTNEVVYMTTNSVGAVLEQTMFANWRLCYLIGGIPVIYGIVLHFAMLESPHWLSNVGRKKDAVKVLEIIERRSVGTTTEYDPNLLIVPPKPQSASVSVLFSDKYILGTCAIWSIYFIGQFCVYGMNAWLPAWFKDIGYTPSQAVALQTWNNFAAILSNSLCGIIGDRVGRKRNCLGAWLFAIVVVILCSVFVAPNQFLFCIGLMLLFGFALNYAITTCNLLMPEQYPTAIRNTGVSWCQAFARFGGSASSIVLGGIASMALFQLSDGVTNWSMVVLVLIIPFALGFICALCFVRDTSGKSMDELESEKTGSDLNGKVPFAIMCVIAVLLFVLCIVCPLAISNWSKLPAALPLMGGALLLPFVFFFVYGGRRALQLKGAQD